MLENTNRFAALIGRLLLSSIFFRSGFSKIGNWSKTAANMESHGMIAVGFFLFMAIVFELTGALSVLAGYRARIGAALLVIFIVPVTLIFHNFWAVEAVKYGSQLSSFMKNAAITGGLLMILSNGSGGFSLDNFHKK